MKPVIGEDVRMQSATIQRTSPDKAVMVCEAMCQRGTCAITDDSAY